MKYHRVKVLWTLMNIMIWMNSVYYGSAPLDLFGLQVPFLGPSTSRAPFREAPAVSVSWYQQWFCGFNESFPLRVCVWNTPRLGPNLNRSNNHWLVVWNIAFIFPFSWERHHPNWRTPSFFRGVGLNHQPDHVFWVLFLQIHPPKLTKRGPLRPTRPCTSIDVAISTHGRSYGFSMI